MGKRWGLLVTTLLTLLVISGCGSNAEETSTDENGSTSKEKKVEVLEKRKEEAAKKGAEEETAKEEEESAIKNNSDFAELITYMEEETEGTTKILYENKEPQVYQMDGVTVSLDTYTLLELKDFHTNYSIPFNDQTDGGIILAQYTVTNELDKDVYYMPAFYLSFTGAQKAHNNYRNLLPLEEQLSTKLAPANDYLLKAGESVTGYYTYPFGPDALTAVLDVSTAAVEVPAALAVKDDYSSSIGKKGQFTLSLNEAGAKKVEANAAFYQDKATTADMGEKKMLKEESGIGKSEQLGDVTVTLDGYQFTEFIPNAVEAPRFENFKNGVVFLTVKFQLDNKGSDSIGLSSMSSKLTVNDGSQYMLLERMLLDYGSRDVIVAGESGELLQIYVLDKEQYDLIWKNKSFEVEIGPIRNEEAKDISKGKKATFEF